MGLVPDDQVRKPNFMKACPAREEGVYCGWDMFQVLLDEFGLVGGMGQSTGGDAAEGTYDGRGRRRVRLVYPPAVDSTGCKPLLGINTLSFVVVPRLLFLFVLAHKPATTPRPSCYASSCGRVLDHVVQRQGLFALGGCGSPRMWWCVLKRIRNLLKVG